MEKILCIEDAPDVIAIIETAFKDHEILWAKSINEAKRQITQGSYQAVLLDIELPDGDGLALLGEGLLDPHKVPIVLLTGKKDFASKVTAFTLGAEDFIVKPFDPVELKLRVEAKIKKFAHTQEEANFKVGDLVCSSYEQKIWQVNGNVKEAISLTSLEFRLFITLAKKPERIYSRADLLEKVWGSELNVTDRTVDTHVAHLRKKLVKSNVSIETVFGSGYRLRVRS